MNIEFIKARENEMETFRNIYEFYLYDFSKFLELDVNENGRFFVNETEEYINNEYTDAILIKKDGKYAGSMLVLKKRDINVIEEFGIMPKYRNGFFTYKVIREYFLNNTKTTKFTVLNENKEWLKCIEYMIRKNSDICEIIEKREIVYHKSKEKKYKFTSFLVKHV